MLIIHKYRPGKAIFAYFYSENHTKPQNKNEHQKGLSEKQTGMQGYIYRLGGKCYGVIRRIPLRRFQPIGGKIPALEEKQSRRLFRIPYTTPGQIPVQVQRRRTVLDQRRCRRCLSLECLRQRQFADRIINSPQLLFFIAPEVPGRCFYFQTSPVTNNTVNTTPADTSNTKPTRLTHRITPSHKVRQNERRTETPKNCLNAQTDRAKNTPEAHPHVLFFHTKSIGSNTPPQFLAAILASFAQIRMYLARPPGGFATQR